MFHKSSMRHTLKLESLRLMICWSFRLFFAFNSDPECLSSTKLRFDLELSIGYIDVGDGCWEQNVLLTVKDLYDVSDGFGTFDHEYPLSFNISVGNQQSNDLTNVHESSPTFSRQHQDVTNIIVTLSICHSLSYWPRSQMSDFHLRRLLNESLQRECYDVN